MTMAEEISSIREDVNELRTLLDSAKRDKVKSALSIELRRMETKLALLVEQQQKNKDSEVKVSNPTSTRTGAYDMMIKNYSWDQSDAFIKVYLTGLDGAKEVDQSQYEFKPESSSIFFKINDFKGKNMIFNIKELSSNLNVEKSYYKAKTDMVVLFLKKSNPGQEWKYLKKVDQDSAEKPKFTPKTPNDTEDPSANLMSMMKQMYEEGDDEMKRTIAKAWTESQSKKPDSMGGLPGGLDLPSM